MLQRCCWLLQTSWTSKGDHMKTKPTWWPTQTMSKQDKVVLRAKHHLMKQEMVEMFKSPKLRWTACGLCPVWLVPEKHEEVV